MRLFLIVFGISLAGCTMLREATNTKSPEQILAEKVEGWIGKSSSELFSRLGPPTKVFEIPKGGRIYTYEKIKEHAHTVGSNTNFQTYSCKVNYTVNEEEEIIAAGFVGC